MVVILSAALVISLASNTYLFLAGQNANRATHFTTTTITQLATVVERNTMTTSQTYTVLSTQTTSITKFENVTTAVSELIIPCDLKYANGAGPDEFSLHIKPNSTALLCVRYFSYNFISNEIINTARYILISGERNEVVNGGNSNSNFTIEAYPSSFTIAGPTNKSEGQIVIYTITAKPNSSGSYMLDVAARLYPQFLLCSGSFNLFVGNGLPDYSFTGSCINRPENLTQDLLYAQIVGASNSTT